MGPFLDRGGVWARMSPDDKRTLMELLGDGSVADDGGEVPGRCLHPCWSDLPALGLCVSKPAMQFAARDVCSDL